VQVICSDDSNVQGGLLGAAKLRDESGLGPNSVYSTSRTDLGNSPYPSLHEYYLVTPLGPSSFIFLFILPWMMESIRVNLKSLEPMLEPVRKSSAYDETLSGILDPYLVLLPTLPGDYCIKLRGHASDSMLPAVTCWLVLFIYMQLEPICVLCSGR
jgi:hypothetical protein